LFKPLQVAFRALNNWQCDDFRDGIAVKFLDSTRAFAIFVASPSFEAVIKITISSTLFTFPFHRKVRVFSEGRML